MSDVDTTRRAMLIQLSALAVTACAGSKPGGSTVEGDSGLSADGSDGTGGTDGTGGSDGFDGTGGTETGWLPECTAADQPLPPDCGMGSPMQGEGPFLRDDVPERQELNVTGDEGEPIILSARILDHTCTPIPGAEVILWSAGGTERFYDTESADANLYGRQYTDEYGAVCFYTLKPTPYGPEGNTLPAHFHLVVNVDDKRVLTTQLYFEGDEYLETIDFPPPPQLIIAPETLADGTLKITYDFMVPPPPPE